MEHSKKPTFLECMGRITDPRKPYNQLHVFLDIVVIAVLATLCCADTWNEIESWGKACQEWLSTFLTLENGIPSHDTFNRVFQLIDPEEFHRIFLEWIQAAVAEIKGVVSIDGKTIRRSRDGKNNKKAIHVVSAWAGELSLVLGQEKVEEKTNEITAIPELLKKLALEGCTITIDAMGTQKKIAKQIIDQKADYILQVKGNQETLESEISEYFEKEMFPKKKTELEGRDLYFKEICKDHGRLETREYYIEKEISWMKDALKEWKGLSGIGACRATIEENGSVTTNTSYAIFSDQEMTAKKYGECKRSHWQIENSLHWCLDIAFNEDQSRMRKGYAAENMNILRHMCLNMLKQETTCKMGIKGKRKKCGWDHGYLIKVLENFVVRAD